MCSPRFDAAKLARARSQQDPQSCLSPLLSTPHFLLTPEGLLGEVGRGRNPGQDLSSSSHLPDSGQACAGPARPWEAHQQSGRCAGPWMALSGASR